MAATLVTGPACAAVLALLKANSSLTAVVPAARIVDEGPSSSSVVYPWILVESQGETPFNTLGAPTDTAFGSSARIGVRVISQYRGDTELNSIMSLVRGALDGQRITIAPFVGDLLTLESTSPMFKTPIGGIPTREQVAEFDLTVHQ